MQQIFQTSSAEERVKMTHLFNKHNTTQFDFTPDDGFDKEDGYFTGKTGNQVVFEVKCRRNSSSKYPTTIIELDKVEHLLKIAKESNRQAMIFFFFTDNTYMIQPLSQEVKYEWSWRAMPYKTMGNDELVPKQVIEFPITKIHNYN